MKTRLALATAALAALAGLTACAELGTVSPLPADPSTSPSTSDPATTPPADSPSPATRPSNARAGSPSPATGPTTAQAGCYGVVTYEFSTQDQLIENGLCIKVGGKVLIRNTDPGTVTVTPSGAAVCNYEAGATACRMTTVGKLTLGFKNGTQPRTMTVVVIA
jgi:hypothetical protein